jgi:hypothetical protein
MVQTALAGRRSVMCCSLPSSKATYMKRGLFLAVLIGNLGVNAQPTLNSSSYGAIGQSFTLVEATYVELPNTGADQTWDVSEAVTTGGGALAFAEPGTGAAASSFPSANLLLAASTEEEYISVTGAAAQLLGTYQNGLVNICSDQMKLMQFPCTFGTTWSDSFSCGYTVAGTTYTTTGSINANASGYGVLVLPYGAITNVLRVDVTETSNFSVGGQPVTLSQTTQFFWRPGTGNYIAKNLVLSEVIDGTPVPLDEEINYLAQGSIGMDEMLRRDIGISVSPNPTNDHAEITFGAQGDIAVAVFDAQGREVSSVRLGQHAPGIHQHQLDLTGLMDGIYTVVLTNDKGERGQQRIVLQR